MYSLATLVSGSLVMFVGGWIDKTSLKRFVLFAACGLMAACLVLSAANNYWMLLVGFILVRLFGQAMMPHTGITTMARSFDSNRGKAISVSTSAMPVGEILLPIVAVFLIANVGYENSWRIYAATIPFVLIPALFFLLNKSHVNEPISTLNTSDTPKEKSGSIRAKLIRDYRFWLAIPALMSGPFVVTGLFIQQAYILQQKNWSFEWFAFSFTVYGVVHWVSSIFSGVLVDKFSARKLLPFYLLPMVIGLVLLGAADGLWVSVLVLSFMGMTIGCASPMSGALWAEAYGTEKLGGIRSLTTTIMVWSTAISPFLLGLLIDREIAIFPVALSVAALLGTFSVLTRWSYYSDSH